MPASSNCSVNQEGCSCLNGVEINSSCPLSGRAFETLGHRQKLKHNPGLTMDWSADEIVILEEGLREYASDSTVVRYAKIAMALPDKTIRDVAIRCRWMQRKDSGKRRKDELLRRTKDKREKIPDLSSKQLSHLVKCNGVTVCTSFLSMDFEEIPYLELSGPTRQHFDQNVQAFSKIAANLGNLQVAAESMMSPSAHEIELLQENIHLFCKARDTIFSILNNLNDMTGAMKQMPPLPVKLNEELADSVLFHLPRQG